MSSKHTLFTKFALITLIIGLLGGCVTVSTETKETDVYFRPERTVASFEQAGKWWGTRHREMHLSAGQIDQPFVDALVDPQNLDFFWVHPDLKDAFIKGYRFGYQERTADLVLGPHITEAAARIGRDTAKGFVTVINNFEKGWADELTRGIHVFITLISEGSQADRERFINQFTEEYAVKYDQTQKMLKEGGYMTQVSEGGTLLHIDARKTIAILEIPSPKTLKAEIYHQTFKVMGDELGRRYSHNLIKREELIDLLRRSKTALEEVPDSLSSNLGIIKEAFIQSYGTDASGVFNDIIREAGYKNPEAVSLPGDRAERHARSRYRR